jgi:hypothetical protein
MGSTPTTYTFELTVTNGVLSWAPAQFIVNEPCTFSLTTGSTSATLVNNGFSWNNMTGLSPFSPITYSSTALSFSDSLQYAGEYQFQVWVNYNGAQTLVSSVNSAIVNENS